jgi:beta-glucanase (GH16 family)
MKKTMFTVKCIIGVMMLFNVSANAQLWWGDEFNGSGSPSSANWNIDHANGGFGNNELQFYTNRTSNVTQGSNCLQIIARRENYGGNAYTSGKITSSGKRHWGSGWIEGRMSLPQGQGLWPAFWMLGVNIGSVGWPACGEIDIMEHVNSSATVHGTIHWNGPSGYAQYGGASTVNVSGWHNYQINWNQYSIKWYVDGVQYHAANITNNINSTEEFHRDFFIILNLAVGGNWPGAPNSSTPFPSTMWVDYVRVYAPSQAARESTVEVAEEIVKAEQLEESTGGLYPNPVMRGNSFTVKVKNYNPRALVSVGLIDLSGKIVANETGNKESFTITTGDHMKEGLYLVKVTNGTNTYVRKLIMQ